MSAYTSEDIDRLEPAYLKSYGLQEAPFSTTHHNNFMYLDAERAQRLNMLQHMCHYSNLLLIVQGVHGVGKTALLQRFIQTAEPDWQVCEISANTMIDAEQLLFQAAQGFGVRQLPQDASELQEMLYARVSTFHHNDQTPILIIDDAHELPKDALLAIFNLADAYVNDVNLLRIILFCEPQIEKIISSKDVKALRERVTHTMEIPPLDEEGTAEYIKHRMAAAGFNGSSPFTPKLVKKIYRASHGVPAKINLYAHQALEEGDVLPEQLEHTPEERGLISQERRQAKPVVYITAAILMLVVAIVFQDQINSVFEETPESGGEPGETASDVTSESASDGKEQIITELDLQERIIPLSESETPPAANDTADEMLASEIDQAGGVELRADTPEPKNKSSDAYSTEADSEAPQATTEDIQVVPADTKQTEQAEVFVELRVDAINPNPVPTSRSQQTISISGQGFTPNSEVVVSWTGNEKKLSKTQINYVSENQIDIAITVGSSEDDWRVNVVDPEAGKSNTASFRVAQFDQGYQKDKWLLTQNPGDFTLQLFGTNKEANAEEFIQQHRLGDEAGYFYSRDDGKDWYRVIYGAFPDKAAAQQAASSLPATLKVEPWVRRLDDIQASINASRKVTQRNRPKTTTATAVSEPTSFPLAGASSAEYESWLWSQDPAKFTLQLLGARQSDSIKKFLRKYSKLNGKAVYFHTRHNDRDWYTVVYGVYETRKQAQQAIKRLPDELQTASPWIRSFASIHAELDRAE